jgi:hypothetical protein
MNKVFFTHKGSAVHTIENMLFLVDLGSWAFAVPVAGANSMIFEYFSQNIWRKIGVFYSKYLGTAKLAKI